MAVARRLGGRPTRQRKYKPKALCPRQRVSDRLAGGSWSAHAFPSIAAAAAAERINYYSEPTENVARACRSTATDRVSISIYFRVADATMIGSPANREYLFAL